MKKKIVYAITLYITLSFVINGKNNDILSINYYKSSIINKECFYKIDSILNDIRVPRDKYLTLSFYNATDYEMFYEQQTELKDSTIFVIYNTKIPPCNSDYPCITEYNNRKYVFPNYLISRYFIEKSNNITKLQINCDETLLDDFDSLCEPILLIYYKYNNSFKIISKSDERYLNYIE